MTREKRRTGVGAIGDVPWGRHFCLFYQTKQDLTDVLVPYFKAGLEDNEFCLWVAAEPLNEEEAREAMREAMPEFDRYLERGQIEIVPHTEWYLKNGVFDLERVLHGWMEALSQALAKGYEGLRVTGNMAWLEKEDWESFADYEEAVDKVIPEHQMIVICAYSLDKCGASEMIDAVSSHESALFRRAGKWEIIENSRQGAFRKSEVKYRTLVERLKEGVYQTDLEGNIITLNQAGAEIYGFDSPEEVVGKWKASDFYPDPDRRARIIEGIITQCIK